MHISRVNLFPLPLLMLRIPITDNVHTILPLDRLTAFTQPLDTRSRLHPPDLCYNSSALMFAAFRALYPTCFLPWISYRWSRKYECGYTALK
jgi:hypothetical protein